MAGFLIENEVQVVKGNDLGTALVEDAYYPASTGFIDMAGIDHGVFLVALGAVDGTPTLRVMQDTSATVTASVKAVTGAEQALLGTEDNKFLTIEFNANQIDRANGFRYVTLQIHSGGALGGNDYAQVFFLGFNNRKEPITKNANWAYHVAVVS